MSIIAGNIRFLRGLKKLTQEKLSIELDITHSRLGAYEESRSEPPIEVLIKLSNFFHVTIDALVRYDLTKTDPDALMKVGKNRILFPVMIDKEGNDIIEVLPIKAMAGYLRGYGDPEYIERMQQMKLPFLPSGKHRAFPIKGDSMLPIKDGSFVVGKYIETVEDIKNGQTYVLLTKEEGIVYKRIQNYNKKAGTIELHSDNKTYQPYTIHLKEVLELWEFTCCINLKGYDESELNMESIYNMLRGLQVEVQRIKK